MSLYIYNHIKIDLIFHNYCVFILMDAARQIIGKGKLDRLDENIKSIINKWDSEYIVQVIFNYYCREMKLYLIMEMIKMTVKNNKQIYIARNERYISREIRTRNDSNTIYGVLTDHPIVMQLLNVKHWLVTHSAKWITLNPLALYDRPFWNRQKFQVTALDKINNMISYLECCGAPSYSRNPDCCGSTIYNNKLFL